MPSFLTKPVVDDEDAEEEGLTDAAANEFTGAAAVQPITRAAIKAAALFDLFVIITSVSLF